MARARKSAAMLDLAKVAVMSFEPVKLDLQGDPPDRARFMEQAGNAFVHVHVGAAMLTKDPGELAAILKAQGENGIIEVLNDLASARQWFAGFVQVLEAVEARAVIAAARVAVEA